MEDDKKIMDSIMGSMIEAMSPMLAGGQLLGGEATAWDAYVCTFTRTVRMPEGHAPPENIGELAIQFADQLLEARRQRFNETAMRERMRGMLPSGRQLCNEPFTLPGEDGKQAQELRCLRPQGHDGHCY